MNTIIQDFNKKYNKLNKKFPSFNPGDTVRVHQKIIEGKKERTQVFEGLIIAKKGKKQLNTTITVRKISNGVGVERIFP
jgi:large subunit ribosomal protein L19